MTALEAAPAGPGASDRQRLPVIATIGRCYRDLWQNLRGLIAVAGLWIVIGSALAIVLGPGEGGLAQAGSALGGLVELVGAAAIASVWHRHVILAVPLAPPMAPVGVRAFRYLLWYLAIGVVAILPGFILVAVLVLVDLAIDADDELSVLTFAPLIVLAVSVVIWSHLCLVLPAKAVDDTTMSMRRSWRIMRGNATPFVLGGLLVAVAPAIAVTVMVLMAAFVGSWWLAVIAASIGAFVIPAVWASYLSFVYLYLVADATEAVEATEPSTSTPERQKL